MTTEQILPLIQNRRKGSIVTLTTSRPAKTRKGAPALTKVSTYQVRIGHDYEAQAATKAAREAGMEHRDEADDYAKRLNEHLSYNKENGRVYLSCQPINTAVRSCAFIGADGTVYSKMQVLNELLASETRPSENSLHLRVPVDTITSLA